MLMKGYLIGWVFVIALGMAIIHNKAVDADTNVSGYISSNTTWTKANSPYVVTGGVVVKSGITLTIEPGVTVRYNAGLSIQVDGALIAKGTSVSNITFTRNSGNNWGYILFSDSSTDATYDNSGNYESGSILEYCVVEYAGGVTVNDNGAIRMNNAFPFINHCTIRNNVAPGIYGYNLAGTLKITNNTIADNKASGVSLSHASGGGTIISGCTIKNNTLSNSAGGGIYSVYGTVMITNNTISGNTSPSPSLQDIAGKTKQGVMCWKVMTTRSVLPSFRVDI